MAHFLPVDQIVNYKYTTINLLETTLQYLWDIIIQILWARKKAINCDY